MEGENEEREGAQLHSRWRGRGDMYIGVVVVRFQKAFHQDL